MAFQSVAARPRRRAAAVLALQQAVQGVRHCALCNTFTEAVRPTCLDLLRDAGLLCVVETPADQAALERTGAYRGRYFVLMGRISPLDGIGAHDIALRRLFERVAHEPPREADPGDQLHRRGRGDRACDRAGAPGTLDVRRSRGWRAACRSAASSNTSISAPSRTRWSTAAEACPCPGALSQRPLQRFLPLSATLALPPRRRQAAEGRGERGRPPVGRRAGAALAGCGRRKREQALRAPLRQAWLLVLRRSSWQPCRRRPGSVARRASVSCAPDLGPSRMISFRGSNWAWSAR